VASPFRLDELGSLEFQRLCVALLDLELGGFETRLWGLSLLVDDGVGGLPRPTLVLVVWDRRGASAPSARLHDLVEDALADRAQPVGSLLVVHNVPGHDLPRLPGVERLVLGPEQLWERFSANASARFRAPSALGVADLDALIAPEVAARSTADIAGAAELARVFVPTRAYTQALGVLERHHFAVLTGPPEMGKTAIARMIGLAALTNGWEMHECIRPDDLWSRLDRNRPQVFVADDAFGSTEYRPEAAERWAVDLDRVLHAMDDRHWLVWTSRPAPLKAGLRRIHREHGVERFPQPAEVGVDAAQLDSTEKALILFRHTKLAALPETAVRLVQLQGWRIVSHEHFTPERIRRFVGGRLRHVAQANDANLNAAVVAEIREPTEAMAASYHALAPEQRAVLLSLLDVAAGPVTERELVAAVRRHSPGGLEHPVNEIVDRLADHFVRVVHPAGVTWVHPSWRDLVIDELAGDADARHDFLRACGIHGIVLALSTAGGAAGARSLPLLVHDADWDALADRVAALIPELEAPEVTMLLAALGEARQAAPEEGNALATDVLGQLARLWDRGATAAPVGLLAAWFELAAELEEQPHPPSAAPAWFDLVPTGRVDIVADAVEFDDWAALVELLAERAPGALQALGFPDKQRLVLLQFIDDAQDAVDESIDLPHVDAVIRSLMRLAAVGLDAERAFRVAWRLRHPRVVIEEAAAEPRELSPELQRLLDFTMPATSEQMRVERVLRDL
jgi:hypothetical protein